MQNAGGAEGEQPSEEESDRELQDGGDEGAEDSGESVPPAQEVQHVNRGIVLLKGFNFQLYSFINSLWTYGNIYSIFGPEHSFLHAFFLSSRVVHRISQEQRMGIRRNTLTLTTVV